MIDALTPFMRRGKITDRLISKAVLAPIAEGYAPPEVLVNYLGIAAEVKTMRQLYRQFGGDSNRQGSPKYLPFYKAIKDKFPSFEWSIVEAGKQPHVTLKKPFINYARPSLLTLLICVIRGQVKATPPIKVRYPVLKKLPDHLAAEMGEVLQELNFHLPKSDYFSALAQVLAKGLAGEEITLISPVCPDYSFEKKGDKFRYTFDKLGDGIGLVARRIVNTLPGITALFNRHGIKTQQVIAAGDFEGFDLATVERVGESRASFQEKLRLSQKRILAELGLPARSIFISELANGESGWRAITSQAHHVLADHRTPNLMPTKVDLQSVLEARLPLYRAWHGERPQSQYAKILLEQCAEYAAMGRLFHQHFSNPLVIGGDHNRMMPFYWLHQEIPVLYLRRVY